MCCDKKHDALKAVTFSTTINNIALWHKKSMKTGEYFSFFKHRQRVLTV